MHSFIRPLLVLALVLIPLSSAPAATVAWTDWTSATPTSSPTQVHGTLTFGAQTVNVTYTGAGFGVQLSGGTNYWNPSAPYISATVDNAPPAADIIQLSTGGTATITFSQPVKDPLLALVSWNGNTVDFNVPITFLSYGHGFWGNGTPIINSDGDGFYGSGEVHGVLQLTGFFDSITFSHTSEGWHGLTVGAFDVVPVPPAVWLLGTGLVGLFSLRKFRR